MKFDLLSASFLLSDTSYPLPSRTADLRSCSKINEFPGCLTNEESLPPPMRGGEAREVSSSNRPNLTPFPQLAEMTHFQSLCGNYAFSPEPSQETTRLVRVRPICLP